jgi:uncharacterized protein (TIGR03437 family)
LAVRQKPSQKLLNPNTPDIAAGDRYGISLIPQRNQRLDARRPPGGDVVTRNGIGSAPLQFPVGEFSPGIFTTSGTGSGMAWAIFAAPSKIHPKGQVEQATSVGTYLGVPATAGDRLCIYAAGLGPAKHMLDGQAPCPLANNKAGPCPASYNALDYSTTTTPVIMVGGVQAKVDASILNPTYPGLYLVFFEIPVGSPKGNTVLVQLQIPGGPSTDPANVTIAIQ